MRIVLLGAGGQLATDVAALCEEVVPLSRADLDVTDAAQLAAVLGRLHPEGVINTAAYNLVDRAEAEPEAAFAVNAFAVRRLAQWCGQNDVALMHVSTDYVFGLDRGRSRPYREEDGPGPLSAYGASKLTGEYFVQAHCPRHYVVRTCGLYGRSATRTKGNFVRTILRLGKEKPQLRVINDQRCTPTSTADLARALVALLNTDRYGLYHVTNAGSATWYEFAVEALRLAGIETPVVPITSAEFGAAALRPSYSVLDCSRFSQVTGMSLPPWQTALAEYVGRIAE